MNLDLHGLIALALANPIISLAILASACVGLALPWIVEANVPMADWAAWKFRLATYGIAVLSGLVAGITIWHSWSAFSLWVPALAINCARDIASHFLPWLSPRAQAVVLKKNAQGDVVGVKVGDDPTIVITKPPGDVQ